MKLFFTTVLCIGVLMPSLAFAQVRGIVVSPTDILRDSNTVWPFTTDVTVTNNGDSDEWIEIKLFGDVDYVTVSPSQFALPARESARVVVTFDEPGQSKSIGSLSISATRNNPDGVAVGTGVNIPFAVSDRSLTVGDMQRAAAAGALDEGASAIKTLGLIALLLVTGIIIGKTALRMARTWNNG